jgi:metallophosphoesterase superfamily enzyme
MEPNVHVALVDTRQIRRHQERVLVLDDVHVGAEQELGTGRLALDRALLAWLERLQSGFFLHRETP